MRNVLLASVVLLGASAATAFPTGTIQCLNREGLPNNVYKIQNLDVDGVAIPHVEITRYYKGGTEAAPTVDEVKIMGLASYAKSGRTELLTVAAVRLEFEGDQLVGCRAPQP